ncbi:MAG TPA: ABC transporter permease [Bacteroidales bacterium]|nr:ABC transporter permease [Bacteroidales bacterium]
MLRNYIISSIRNLVKRKTYSIINILGLTAGLASFLIIFLYIVDELSYDKYHKNADRVYRLVNIYDFDGVGENSASSPFPVAFTLKNDFTGMIDNVVRVFNFQAPRSFIEHGENKFNERNFFFADSTFFDIFNYDFIQGNPSTALDENGAVVISETMAKKYFGDENPMDQTIKYENNLNLKVTGVIKDVPEQSHFKFDFIGSMSTLRAAFGGKLPQTWVWNPCWTYLLLSENADPKTLENKFPEYIQKYFYDAEKDNISLYLQPLTDIHLKSKLDYELAPNNDISTIYILAAIAVFLLIIAVINYMNLATATSSGRTKEIGIKKVTGASQTQLIIQFIGESVIISFISLAFAFIISELVMPWFNNFTGKSISIATLFEPGYMLILIGLGVLVGILAGTYPAFYLSRFKPVTILKGGQKLSTRGGLPRKILVVVQFTISIGLIIGTLIIRDQLKYMQNADLGFDKENILILPINRTPIVSNFESFKAELLQNPDIISVTAMDDIFGSSHNTHEFRPEGFPEDQWQFYPALVVQYDFLKTFKIPLVAGRDYLEANSTDPINGIIINESMVRHMGWGSPQDAIGKKFKSLQGEERVIGVFRDFHQTSLHETVGPFVLNMKETPGAIRWFLKYMAIRIQPGKEREALAYIEAQWNKTAPDRPFEFTFLNQELAQLYKDEKNLSSLSVIFTIIVIFIATLGLAGLASYLAEQRTKEIGIRKVLGASTLSIIKSLSREFIFLIFASSILSWIISYLIMDDWLKHFPYQSTMNWLVFFIATFLALILTLLISGVRGWIAAQADPVKTLKYE